MVVFECLVNKDYGQGQLNDAVIQIISIKEDEERDKISNMNRSDISFSVDEEDPEDSVTWCEALPAITGGVELHLLL